MGCALFCSTYSAAHASANTDFRPICEKELALSFRMGYNEKTKEKK